MGSISPLWCRCHPQLQIPSLMSFNPSFCTSLTSPAVSTNPHRNSYGTSRNSSIIKLSLIPGVPASSFPETKRLSTASLPRKCLVFLVGAFVFVGSLGVSSPRISLALPAEVADSDDVTEEEANGTQMEVNEGVEMHEKLVETDPRNVAALKAIVYGKMRRGKNKEAAQYVKRLIDIEPDEVEWRLLEALCFEMMGQLCKAKRLFKEILEERPLLLRALHGLAMVMHKNHEGLAIFGMLNKALEVSRQEKRVTEERNIRILIAQMHVVMGNLEEGLTKFQDLINENPRDFRPYLCQGIIYSLLERKTEAAEQFETYRSLVPEEFPQRRFLDDVVLASKTNSREWLQKEFGTQFSRNRK
ncbi:unnamed protein product [Linum trigynum]|uniref:Chloroplast lumen common family protein n=1 Tax=Linum trigynum TaxID=586398 RepID=A0AAV2DLN0_9ROSI